MRNDDEFDSEKNVDIKKVFFRALNYWFIFPIFILLSTGYAFYQYMKTNPTYKVGTKLMIGRGQSLGEGVSALPQVMLNQAHYENQYIILTSRRQIEKTLRQLDFEVSYFRVDRYREIEIYKNTPFLIIIDSAEVKPSNLSFAIHFTSRDQFVLSSTGSLEFEREVKFFEKVTHPKFSFTIVPNEETIGYHNYIGSNYSFHINSLNRLISYYQGRIKIEPVRGGSSIVELSLVDRNIEKAKDFLNMLALSAVSYTLDKKNQIASNTIEFIEKQLSGVQDSLGQAENVLEEFKSRQAIVNMTQQGALLINQSNELESRRNALRMQIEQYSFLESLLDNKNIQTISAQGITDPTIVGYINDFQKYIADRQRLLFNSSLENPQVQKIDRSIETLKNTMVSALQNAKASTQFQIDEINKRLMGVTSDIRKLPSTGQTLSNIERTHSMNNEMYNFLMQRRWEAQMAKASNLPDNEIIEEAQYKYQVAPDLKRNILLVIIGGFVFPAVLIFLIIFLNDKIQDLEDIKSISAAPVIGQIPLEKVKGSKNKKSAISSDQPNTILAEAFRSIRVSLGFYATQKKTKTILFTSTLPGEGKSFCTINVAHSFAQLGKSTILVEFDLRRPSVAKQSGLKLKTGEYEGLSNYYTGEKDIHKLIYKNTGVPNFHIIFSGQIPPNPAELIASEETEALITYLQKQYDIVIIDTPPLGLVSDAHLLAKYADVNLLVIRHNSTPKPILKMNLKDEKTKNMHSLAIILNGIPFQKRGYNYQYGYNMRNKYITRKG